MKKIVLKWLFISIGVGLIPVLILGASPGGVALSPIIIILSLVVGLLGASVHVTVFAFLKGSDKQKKSACWFSALALAFVSWVVYSSVQCSLSEEYAISRATSHIDSRDDLDLQYLGGPRFDIDSCLCQFSYSAPDEQFTLVVSEYGELHFVDE